MDTHQTAVLAAEAALSKKAEEIKIHDLHELSSVTDYFVICTGSTDVHCRAIHDEIKSQLKQHDIRAWHVEGVSNGRWILMDFVDFVVHIFQPKVREFYSLERIWGDAKVEIISDEANEA